MLLKSSTNLSFHYKKTELIPGVTSFRSFLIKIQASNLFIGHCLHLSFIMDNELSSKNPRKRKQALAFSFAQASELLISPPIPSRLKLYMLTNHYIFLPTVVILKVEKAFSTSAKDSTKVAMLFHSCAVYFNWKGQFCK